MKRTGQLKRRSAKRAALDRKADKWRQAFVRTIGFCELCNRNYSLACHEISSGTASRRKSLMEPACILVLCNAMHRHNRPSCHSVVGLWPRAKQLALLLIRRGGDYDLNRYHEIVAMNKPDQSEVDGWVEVLLKTGGRV